jgi:hypothetical protein
VATAAATLGEMLYSAPSTSSTKRLISPLGIYRLRAPPMRCLAARTYWACWVCAGACASRALAGGSAKVWCSRCGLGEDLSRPRLVSRAGTALPCQPGMHLGVWWVWIFPSSSALSHWPRSLTNWSRSVSLAHRPCSVLLFAYC